MEGEEGLLVELVLHHKSSSPELCLDNLFFGNLAFEVCNLSGYLLHDLYFINFPDRIASKKPGVWGFGFRSPFFVLYSESFLVQFPLRNLFLIPPVERQFISFQSNQSTRNSIFPICCFHLLPYISYRSK